MLRPLLVLALVAAPGLLTAADPEPTEHVSLPQHHRAEQHHRDAADPKPVEYFSSREMKFRATFPGKVTSQGGRSQPGGAGTFTTSASRRDGTSFVVMLL